MESSQTQTSNFTKLEQLETLYKHIDLTYVDKDLNKINYYIAKYQNYPYRTFCTLYQHVEYVYDEGINKISAIIGYPFSQPINLDNNTLRKCTDIEYWVDYTEIRRNANAVYKKMRPLVLKCHAQGIRFRVATEFSELNERQTNEWLELCYRASIDHFQIGYGLSRVNKDLVLKLNEIIPDRFKIKTVGNINSIELAQTIYNTGANIIGSSTI